MIMGLAVRLTFVVKEAAAHERTAAVFANEAIGMPLRIERGNVVIRYGLIATSALGREQIKVVGAAVHLAILFVEAVVIERLAAVGTEEVLRVPGLVKR
jgi:hypothetical protein